MAGSINVEVLFLFETPSVSVFAETAARPAGVGERNRRPEADHCRSPAVSRICTGTASEQGTIRTNQLSFQETKEVLRHFHL